MIYAVDHDFTRNNMQGGRAGSINKYDCDILQLGDEKVNVTSDEKA